MTPQEERIRFRHQRYQNIGDFAFDKHHSFMRDKIVFITVPRMTQSR